MSQYPPPVPPELPPRPLNYAPPPVAGVDLRAIATRQKAIMYCILGYLALVVLQFAFPPDYRLIVGLAAAAVSITAAVFVFMLALSLYNTGTGVVLGILTLIPIVGLIVLLIINGKATTILRQHNIRVGLMGADASQIRPAGQVPFQ